MISIVINADTRKGFNNQFMSVGEFENGQPNGIRSVDLLTDGVINKMNFFRGYDTQCILYIDIHESIPDETMEKIREIVFSYGNDSKIVLHPHSESENRWNDRLYIDAMKLADGDYIVHFDNDCNAFRSDECNIIEQYFKWLDGGYNFICAPIHPLQKERWYWASTQFFICKKEILNFEIIESCLYTPLMGKHNPCLEYTLGILYGEDTVLYPERNNNDYMVFCWWTYKRGLLKELNEKPYTEVKDFIINCGLTASGW